ncbi:predicted protein [Uncinocarpus reesii 1704]|uniref:DNA ligase D 3'-phosphoesterase domain-containing protein n=1 Tax=Uncinocarpus reesii (strain UAMH 1704) TaxID=336963 RepID=C4JHP7_UNCRE|nr:uncharacterized protein UREG_02733 [Uncinocarpus reesii 1704]EEP77884.1 predicted protein [Uncinocarpus reesii 1704]
MVQKRESQTIENPFIKPQNREWSIAAPASLNAPVSPPRKRRRHSSPASAQAEPRSLPTAASSPLLAAIEAGEARIDDHLQVFSSRLRAATRDRVPLVPRLRHSEWIELYQRNQHPHGRHFVIHQHDHPVAGPHYDLRLQFSETSSLSFAIMYGLPESASASSGSMIIWDTGEYSILPYYTPKEQVETDCSHSNSSDISSVIDEVDMSESDKLKQAFQQRKIRLRLQGTRLPPGYTVTLRLTTDNDASEQPKKPVRQRRIAASRVRTTTSTPPSSGENDEEPFNRTTPRGNNFANHSDGEDEKVRITNAYPGATNSISSIHQRRWYLSLDRVNSGFARRFDASTGKYLWERKQAEDSKGAVRQSGFEPFFVRGPEVERSVVTGRLGRDVLEDEGVEKFVGRRGWRPVLN